MARPKTLITDFRHLPNVETDEFVAGRSLPAFLSGIVAIASLEGPEARVRSPVRCRCRPGRRACPGVILIARHARHSEVEWRCSECEFRGVITHWEGSTWDHSPQPRRRPRVGPPGHQPAGPPTGLRGLWLIEEVQPSPRSFASSAPEVLDRLGPPYLELNPQWGSVRLARLEAALDCRYSAEQVEFCWRGDEDTKELSGRGFARLDGAALVGQLFTYAHEDITFRARRFRDGDPTDLATREKFDDDE